PAADGKRVVVWHSSAGLYCYDFAGKELWHRSLGEFEHIWGYGASR
ncbi:MAG TPA: serine/threonine protein kinase, partial [Gimesia maris]|nr:serine/threonine protein kinase [Gimesia maris]